ncbi:hypothetical protein CN918_25665 [Priestia megaterium]|nr:hypothetical protein CN918_25665 [Priestia megaterium]
MGVFEVATFIGICFTTHLHTKWQQHAIKDPEHLLENLLRERQLLRNPKGIELMKTGNLIEIHLKLGLRTGKIYYNPETKITRYSPYLRYHPFMMKVGVMEMNRWVREIAKTYRPPTKTKKTSTFQKKSWLHFIEVAQAYPLLNDYERNQTSEKKTFQWGAFSLRLVKLTNGVTHISIKEDGILQLEGEYHQYENRVYVTSRSMLKAPYYWLQLELVEFLETFCENECTNQHNRMRFNQVEKEVLRLLQLQKYKSVHKDITSLWQQFSKAKSYNPQDYILMMHSLHYLTRYSSNISKQENQIYIKERYDEN